MSKLKDAHLMRKLICILLAAGCLYFVVHNFSREEDSPQKNYDKEVQTYFSSFDREEIAEYQELVKRIFKRIKDLKGVYPHFQGIDEAELVNEDNSRRYDSDVLFYMVLSYSNNITLVPRDDVPGGARAAPYLIVDPDRGIDLYIQFTIGGRNYEDPKTWYRLRNTIGALKIEMRLNPNQKPGHEVDDREIFAVIQRIINTEKKEWELNPNRKERDARFVENLHK